jgi:hypothetical protein
MCPNGLRAPLSICICLPLPPFQHAAALPLRNNDAPPSSPAALALRCGRGVPRRPLLPLTSRFPFSSAAPRSAPTTGSTRSAPLGRSCARKHARARRRRRRRHPLTSRKPLALWQSGESHRPHHRWLAARARALGGLSLTAPKFKVIPSAAAPCRSRFCMQARRARTGRQGSKLQGSKQGGRRCQDQEGLL